MAGQALSDQVQAIYVAFYGRPADPVGLLYWAQRLAGSNGVLDEIIDSFASSTEYAQRFGGLDTGTLINNLYQQAFGRDAEPAGLAYWTDRLADGSTSLGRIALSLLEGAQNEDRVTIDHRLAAASAFTDSLHAGGSSYSANAIDTARDFLARIDHQGTSFDNALASLGEVVAVIDQLSRESATSGAQIAAGEVLRSGEYLESAVDIGATPEAAQRVLVSSSEDLVVIRGSVHHAADRSDFYRIEGDNGSAGWAWLVREDPASPVISFRTTVYTADDAFVYSMASVDRYGDAQKRTIPLTYKAEQYDLLEVNASYQSDTPQDYVLLVGSQGAIINYVNTLLL
ncbi:DUF4214 domain-containing protein [Stutzerimonas balearica]|jgi:hypothetical protein|uniref:DUF4214 domain-containing protein n=1 Tax=Stutzerimonas balearica TaxID=74829 RepID=UPI0022B058D0|nr:DUF4214 domain-containing protein [Stutzerimonas balearica]MCZ4129143.1 DUF4214 domain-containing protein [Stutzerimonas balearica]